MTASIELENYRGFEKYRLDGLSRVNLLVGGNNCGKTAILEAVHLLARGAHPMALREIALQRGEVAIVQDSIGPQQTARATLLHFFHNRQFALGATFTIRCNADVARLNNWMRACVVSREESAKEEEREQQGVRETGGDFSASIAPNLVVQIKGSDDFPESTYPVTDDGLVVGNPNIKYGVSTRPHWSPNHLLVTTESLDRNSMNRMWDSVIERGREDEVIRAMQILEPELSGLHFLQGASDVGYGGSTGGIIASFKNTRQRTPLGSHGEGMRRLLALSLALTQCKGGVLLIDEIDTGLHYSVMGHMWRLVVETARQADVQVFATTHSSDCVRGLSWLCQNYPELGGEVSLQKIEPELDKAVGLDAEQIILTDRQDIEVR